MKYGPSQELCLYWYKSVRLTGNRRSHKCRRRKKLWLSGWSRADKLSRLLRAATQFQDAISTARAAVRPVHQYILHAPTTTRFAADSSCSLTAIPLQRAEVGKNVPYLRARGEMHLRYYAFKDDIQAEQNSTSFSMEKKYTVTTSAPNLVANQATSRSTIAS